MNTFKRVITALIATAVLVLIGAQATSASPTIPGVDCTTEPVTGPNSGMASLDPGPKTWRNEDPFADGARTTIYEVYGWGGLSWTNYDLGCGPDVARDSESSGRGIISGFMWDTLIGACAVTTSLLRFAFAPDTLDIFEPVQRLVADAFGNRIFKALFWLTIIATGIYVSSKGRTGDVVTASKTGGWLFAVMLGTVVVVLWPTSIAPVADKVMLGMVGTAHSAVAGATNPDASIADSAASNLQNGIIYETWKAGMFGRFNGPIADKYGPDLFKAGALTRTEARAIEQDPGKADAIYDAKHEAYSDVAEKIKNENPEAYEYIAGRENAQRAGFAFLGWLLFWSSMGFVLVAAILMAVALLIIRFALMVLPVIALIAAIRPFGGLIIGIGNTVAGAAYAAVIFGVFSAAYVAAVGALASTATHTHPILALLLLVAMQFAAWRVSKPWRSIKNLSPWDKNKMPHWPRRNSRTAPDGAGNDPMSPTYDGREPQPYRRYEGTRPVESLSREVTGAAARGAVTGAAAGLAMAAVTGGTSVAAGAATGATKGAVAAGTVTAVSSGAERAGLPEFASDAAGNAAGNVAARGISARPAPALPAGTTPATNTGTFTPEAGARSTSPIPPHVAPEKGSVTVYHPGDTNAPDTSHLTPTSATSDGVYKLYKGASA